jgi:hypothetical protein
LGYVIDEELRVKKIDPPLGQLLRAVESQPGISLPDEEAAALLEAELVVRANSH